VEIGQVLATITTAISLTKEIAQANKIVDEVAFKLKMAEVQVALADAKIAVSDLRNEIVERDNTIRELRSAIEVREQIVQHQGLDYRRGANGQPSGDPYCPKCLAEKNVRVAMLQTSDGHGGQASRCPSRFNYLKVPSFSYAD
jgi:hypothetical protein